MMKTQNIPGNMLMPEYFWGDDAQLYAMFEHYLTIMRKRLNGSIDPLGGPHM